MKILFVTIAWPAKNRRNLYTDLAESIKKKGHEVSVLTIAEKKEGTETVIYEQNGIDVLRVATGNITKTASLKKGINLIRLNRQLMQAVKKYYKEKKFDLIIATTPPITVSNLLSKLKKFYGSSLYLLLKDIWPQGSVDLGVIKEGSLIWKYFKKHEIKLYKISDFIGCMSEANVHYLLNRYPFLNAEKVEVCPNSMNPYSPETPDSEARQRLNIPENATVFLFSGNLGLGHGLDFYYDCILELQDFKDAFFLIGGAGTHYDHLKQRYESDKPDNMSIYSWLPEEDFKQILLLSDVGVILLSKNYSVPQFPSRLLPYLNHSLPVFCIVNPETDIGNIIEKNGAGISIIHGDKQSFKDAVRKLCELSESEKTALGSNGKKLLLSDYTAERSAEIILNHF